MHFFKADFEANFGFRVLALLQEKIIMSFVFVAVDHFRQVELSNPNQLRLAISLAQHQNLNLGQEELSREKEGEGRIAAYVG